MSDRQAANSADGESSAATDAGASIGLLSPEAEARAFFRLRRRLIVTQLRQAVAHARLRWSLFAVLSLLLWAGLFWLFAESFVFLRNWVLDPGTHDRIVRAVFGLFFAALMVMLLFSSGIILYGSLFRCREVAFLLTCPVRTERVFLHKFQESLVLSSWGFVLLGSPMLLAYGVVAAAPWYYYAMLLPYLVAFVYLPSAVGAVLCLMAAHRLPGKPIRALLGFGAVTTACVLWFVWWLLSGSENDLLTPRWFQEMLARLRVSDQRLLPSWWLSSGLLEATRHAWSESVLFLVVLVANALFLRQVAVWFAARIYRPAYSSLCGRGSGRKRTKTAWIDRLVLAMPGLMSRQMRLIVVKDLRLFRRDVVQWSQFVILFGLLALYFFNIRRFSYDRQYAVWVNTVSFLNVTVVGLLMATFTTRFVFPLISLEGRRFWMLGLLPVRRETILWGKFLFAAGGSIVPCGGLILLSDVMLGVSPVVLASHQCTSLILCVGLSGIAVGLGARLPNLREQSPSRIAAGFGGTLNLTISTLYILAVVVLTAFPCHFFLASQRTVGHAVVDRLVTDQTAQIWLLVATSASLLLGVLATVVPLRIGFRAFRRLEF
ncbi:MAG: hypothetical protein HQ567_11445 [Candidatus Nealsonbacteria bacterium]|nr:hypothetical protein [Candidatus Nealsonbacteria bacterium]